MFRSARIKLTISYILMIMTVTLVLSAVVYFNVDKFTQRALASHERRVENRLREFRKYPNFPSPKFQEPFTEEAVLQVRKNTIVLLISLNSVILLASGAFGYWFAGRTLKPIEEMTRKQKAFVADAAHEIKTPITSIKTQLEISLRNKKLTLPGARKVLESVLEDLESLNSLTKSLLKQSKYETHKIKDYEKFNLKTLIEGVIISFKEKFEEKQIEVKTNLNDMEINADKDSIKELITIMVDNAIKFSSEKGKIEISANKKDKQAEIIIADNGMGINKKDIPFIFDRFYKADQSRTKTNHDGFGLGLSIAKEIVNSHNGKISVDSRQDSGSTFTVLLPLNI